MFSTLYAHTDLSNKDIFVNGILEKLRALFPTPQATPSNYPSEKPIIPAY